MALKPTRDQIFIDAFLSAYEGSSWADARRSKPDAIDRTKKAVDQLATRASDGQKLAIEHTIIEPFVGEKADFANFYESRFLTIEDDRTLPVPGLRIDVFIPTRTAEKEPAAVRSAMVQSVYHWLKNNRLNLEPGESEHHCPITALSEKAAKHITLTVKVVQLQSQRGFLNVRRQQTESNLGEVVMKALKSKVPKLVNTAADRRLLLLERQHMILLPKAILMEIDILRPAFPDLTKVDEIWILETPMYKTAFGGDYFRFERYENEKEVQSYDFDGEKLLNRFENGVCEVVNPI